MLTLPWVASLKRAVELGLAAVIVLACAVGAGYAWGRHSVQPAPGRETALQRALDAAAMREDSLRRVLAVQRATLALLEQRQAAQPTVEVVDSAHVRITPRAPDVKSDFTSPLTPRVVEIPVEVISALESERAMNAALRAIVATDSALIAAEHARADSAVALSRAAMAERPTFWSRFGVTTGYGFTLARVPAVVAPGQVAERWQLERGVQLGFTVRVWP